MTELRSSQQQATEHSINGTDEQLEKLRNDLALAQQDAENLKTAASVNATLANAPEQDGSKSVAEQVADHVAAVRTELEAQHKERIQQSDDAFKLKAKNMAAQLSDKLRESKTRIRQELAMEHEQIIQKLKTEHTQELEKLRTQHGQELEQLQRAEEAKVAELKASSQHGSQSQPPADGSTEVKAEVPKESGAWQPSEQEIRTLIQSNEYLKGILRQNITKQFNKAKEDLTAQLKGQHEKAIADIQSKNEAAKEHAIALAVKKSQLQLNMATNKVRILEFKLAILSKAAQETPEKTVQEVWPLIKDAKPPAAPATAPIAASTGQPQQAAPKVENPATSTFGQPTPAAQSARANTPQHQQPAPNGTATFGRPTPAGTGVQNQNPNIQSSQGSKTVAQPLPNTPNGPQQAEHPQSSSNAPTGPDQGAQTQPHNVGSGQAMPRGSASGIPRGSSMRGNAFTRGGSSARGRGTGIARGAPQSLDTNRAGHGGQQGKGSPNSAVNTGAKQFVPGNKRPSDDPQGGDGKRVRGGGGPGGQ